MAKHMIRNIIDSLGTPTIETYDDSGYVRSICFPASDRVYTFLPPGYDGQKLTAVNGRWQGPMISFYGIDANNEMQIYICPDGWTWKQFIESDFNVDDNFTVYDNIGVSSKGYMPGVVSIQGDTVIIRDKIIAEKEYVRTSGNLYLKMQ